MKAEIVKNKRECALKKENVVLEQNEMLPNSQQEAVKACLAASKVVSAHGRRYTLN